MASASTAADRETLIFQALADPTRREILARISRQRIHVAELAEHFPMSRPAISKHLRALQTAGLCAVEESGKKRIYSLNPAPLAEVDRWLNQYRRFWDQNLLRLKKHMESM